MSVGKRQNLSLSYSPKKKKNLCLSPIKMKMPSIPINGVDPNVWLLGHVTLQSHSRFIKRV